jgi:hypothetical protein
MRALEATAISPAPEQGRLAGHRYMRAAVAAYRCEGLAPLEDAKRVALGHVDTIAIGEPYLKKSWRTASGQPFTTRHCPACALVIEREMKPRRRK